MSSLISKIKSVGFDLDNTLYQENSKIDKELQRVICERILERKPDFESIQNVENYCKKRYGLLGSRVMVFEELGFANPKKTMYECLLEADIHFFLEQDLEVASLIFEVSERYSTFLITSGPEDLSLAKMNKIGIDISLFDFSLFGDSPEFISKLNGQAFEYFLSQSKYPPSHHLYCGDNLKADILPPKSLGMMTIAVGKEIPEADFSVKKIKDIREILL